MDVTVVEDRVVIRGRRREDDRACRTCYQQMEIHYGAFLRVVPIRFPFDRDGIRAAYREGFLTVDVPRMEQRPKASKPVRIRVSDGGDA
jgi:HSP20 family protein